jgi:hypothetical protein
VDGLQPGGFNQQSGRRVFTVDELGTELDGVLLRGEGAIGVHTTPHPIPCFEQRHATARVVKRTRGGKTGCTSTDDEDVGVHDAT